MKAFAAEPWMGEHKIILGFDIGTTFSGVSYAYLFPGGPQTVSRVNAWPGQGAYRSESKIPTLVWYDNNKKATAFGAEALSAEMQDEAEDNGWILAKHFKLHLHPQTMKEKYNLTLDPPPEGVPLSTIYEDLFGYLIKHTQDTFIHRVLDGARVWKTYISSADVVIAHPNGWGLREQDFMRRAVVAANIVPESESHTRIFFVTEGEASVHYCMFHADLASQLKPNVEFVVCDAGGSTVDTTTYSVSVVHPQLQLREAKPSACIQAGGIFVNKAAEDYFSRVFSNPEASLRPDEIKDFVQHAIDDFEANAKKAFQDKDITSKGSVDIGQSRYTNPVVGVKRGRMMLDGSTIETFFRRAMDQIVDSLKEQMSGINCKHILLVGGFGENLCLRETLSRALGKRDTQIVTANDSTAKAVSDGAVIWRAASSVVARACRFQYGISTSVKYDSKNPLHSGRLPFKDIDGSELVSGVWDPIVSRGDVLRPDEGVSKDFFQNCESPNPGCVLDVIYANTLIGRKKPYYSNDENDNPAPGFEAVCNVSVDLSRLAGLLEKRQGPKGTYWLLNYKIGIQFGGTELQAYLEWNEGGKTRKSPAQIIPNSVI
ncbi:uncharacterized protein EI90DRAFT_2968350 [Cantharellus anzutake]|uniref:uncharacterized protein n=1 Tax=Cantharellus anzutake TaxID=1750568 RepID=UPI0019047835|nr:uncharacterized protein EI90DRAFT_2968350 [Cantharellus anzutake]KAF8337473.1 hypothetical protein EI90DRAFT_2968350 [Cantharellus anzutake]